MSVHRTIGPLVFCPDRIRSLISMATGYPHRVNEENLLLWTVKKQISPDRPQLTVELVTLEHLKYKKEAFL